MKRLNRIILMLFIPSLSWLGIQAQVPSWEKQGHSSNDGQTQISFVIPGQEWTIMYNMNRPGGPTGQDNPPQFNKKKIGASVTIGHTTYYPVVSDGYNSRQPNHPDNNRIVYYLREEGDQVYIRYSEAEEEQLLFDYNLEEIHRKKGANTGQAGQERHCADGRCHATSILL